VKESIRKLESVYGHIKCKYGKGVQAEDIINQCEKSYLNSETKHSEMFKPEIDMLILFGRRCDLVTPFCMNRIYEGIADEYFPIETQEMKVPNILIDPVGIKEAIEENKQVSEIMTLNLDRVSDKVFEDLRYSHYQTLESKFQEINKKIKMAT